MKLNMNVRPIANKYCEGNLKTTLNGESKEMKSKRAERNGDEGV